jgi:hypothetical protein
MELNGVKVIFSDIITFNHARGLCPLCREKMDAFQELRLAVSDLNPDIYVHDACIKKEKSAEDAFALVVDDWQRAKEYAYWFR